MMIARVALGVLGLAALAWGGLLALELSEQDSVAAWFLAGPIAHDLVIAPIVGGLGFLFSRWLGPAWRAPVTVAAALTGILIALAIPLLWRTDAPANPGLHDRDYTTGLTAALALIWLGVLAAGLVRAGHRKHQQ